MQLLSILPFKFLCYIVKTVLEINHHDSILTRNIAAADIPLQWQVIYALQCKDLMF